MASVVARCDTRPIEPSTGSNSGNVPRLRLHLARFLVLFRFIYISVRWMAASQIQLSISFVSFHLFLPWFLLIPSLSDDRLILINSQILLFISPNDRWKLTRFYLSKFYFKSIFLPNYNYRLLWNYSLKRNLKFSQEEFYRGESIREKYSRALHIFFNEDK